MIEAHLFLRYPVLMQRVTLLGSGIDPLTREEAIGRLHAILREGKQRHVMTPNSEMLVAAFSDDHFRSVINASDLNLPDSQGIVWMARLTGQRIPERVAGVDAVIALCSDLSSDHSVFLLGAGEGVAAKAAQALKEKNPHLNIAGTFSGSPKKEDSAAIIKRINDAKPHLLLVAYGAPAQDMWIAEHLSQMPSVRVAMGVGGTFDFIAGTAKRAPKIMQSLGLEWAWRLLLQPSRLPRILTAVIRFPLLVLLHRKRPRGELR